MQRTTFSRIEHLLPADCWAVWRNERKDGEFANEPVLYHDGALNLESLDLDDPFGDGRHVFLVFVDGHLTVEGPVLNRETDGASGLIVQGDLSCRSAAVGGQQIYITGGLQVGELFWGDYNHGELVVGGGATAKMFVATGGYGVDIRGSRRFERWILEETPNGESWRLNDVGALGAYIDPEFVWDDDGYGARLWRTKIIDALAAGRNVVRPQDGEDIFTIRRFFPDASVTPDNLRKIAAPHLLRESEEEGTIGATEFWIDRIFCRVTLGQEGRDEPESIVYLQAGGKLAVVIKLANPSLTLGRAVARVFSRNAKSSSQQEFIMFWRNVEAAGNWEPLDARAPDEARKLLADGWSRVLNAVVAQERVRETITPSTVRELLALPLAEPFDYFSDRRNGLWVGDTYCSFLQEGSTDEDGTLQPAQLRVTTEEDNSDLYYYQVVDMADGSESVEVRHLAELGGNDRKIMSFTGGAELERAIQLFSVASANLKHANERLMAGEPPSDDSFALGHWRKKGYLKKKRNRRG